MENNPPRSNFVERIALKKYLNNFHDLCKKKLFPAKRLLLSNQPLGIDVNAPSVEYQILAAESIHLQYIWIHLNTFSIYHQFISIHMNESSSSIHLQYNSIHLQNLYPLTKTGRLLQYQDSYSLTLRGDISTPAKS